MKTSKIQWRMPFVTGIGKIVAIFCLLVYGMPSVSLAQSAVSVGAGSYAEYPPSHEGTGGFATTDPIDVATSLANDPIPTNDWWTSVLTQEDASGNRHGGNLWTYPLVSKATTNGVEIGHRTSKDWVSDVGGSRSMSVDYLVTLAGASFEPTKTIATSWSDWHVELRTRVADNNTNRIDWTLAQGMPYVWARTVGFDPVIEAIHAGVRTFYDANGNVQTFPATIDRLAIEYDGNFYGVHFPSTVTIQQNTQGLLIPGHAGNWVVFSALNSVSDLNTLHQYAFVRPTNTSLDYTYSAAQGKVTTTYNVTTSVIAGNETNVLQGFIPHHYRGNTNAFSFLSGLEFTGTPRGTIKMAAGNNFTFDYDFNADLLPHFNVPEVNSSNAIAYDPAKMETMIDEFTNNVNLYGINGGTYWGGKSLTRVLKYALMAKETGNSNFDGLLAAGKAKVYDWLTYTPGETEFYYAYYPSWKALVGFNEEYGSSQFTDNHFHYGYLAHACALLEIAEPGSMDAYWDMITKVIKTYANWDKTDPEFPYLRTFSPWMGHSFASGLGNTIGNNQESSSEAMQSWAGMFMVGEMTGQTGMRDAAAFGYLMESRAIADYWYNTSGVFTEVGYNKPITGILEMNRFVYGTFFGAQETYIHGIQWLPVTPAYGFWNDFLTTAEANAIVDPIINNMATDLGGSVSADWMNVALGFKLFFDPEAVVGTFESYWNSSFGTDEYWVAHFPGENALTYYYGHASQNLGLRRSDYRLSLPLSSAFEKNGEVSYVVYNPSGSTETCNVYQNGALVTSFSVPANTLLTVDGGGSSGDGLSGTYYNNSDFTDEALTRVDPTVNFTWGSGSPDPSIGVNTFSVRWTGTVTPKVSGTHTFYTRTDDGVRLWIDDQLLVDKWVNQGPTEWTGTIDLVQGQPVSVKMEYYENGGGAVAQLSWAASGVSKEVIPQANLSSITTSNFSTRIQAEDYTSMSGIQTEGTTDEGGGLNVGWINAGDWMDYTVTIPSSGSYQVDYRVASIPGGGTVSFQSSGNTLSTTSIPSTNGWQNWSTLSTTVTLSAGTQTVRLYAPTGGWNINWLDIQSSTSKSQSFWSEGNGDVESIRFFPNPVGDHLTVERLGQVGTETIQIYSAEGRLVHSQSVLGAQMHIGVESLEPGIYFLRIPGRSALTHKFIKL